MRIIVIQLIHEPAIVESVWQHIHFSSSLSLFCSFWTAAKYEREIKRSTIIRSIVHKTNKYFESLNESLLNISTLLKCCKVYCKHLNYVCVCVYTRFHVFFHHLIRWNKHTFETMFTFQRQTSNCLFDICFLFPSFSLLLCSIYNHRCVLKKFVWCVAIGLVNNSKELHNRIELYAWR